ncbi:MAG TPA: AEC family transporter [Anaerovoracaceae bacterium]|nr:AEC family transporter [Anaerovoracaceae bacterium]
MIMQFLILFALIFIGYIFTIKKLISSDSIRALSNIVMFLALPSMVFYRVGTLDMNDGIIMGFFQMVLISFVLMGIGALVSRLYFFIRKTPVECRGVMEFGVIFSNNGFIGFPIALISFGEEGLLMMVATNFALHMVLFTYGIFLMQKNHKLDKKGMRHDLLLLVRQLSNPNIVAAILGLIICTNEFSLSESLWNFFLMVGNMATPLSMMFIGIVLTESKLSEIIKNRKVLEISFLRLVLMPILSWVVLSLFPVSQLILKVGVIFMALPSAATLSLVSIQYKNNSELAAQVVFTTTLFSIATLPLAIMLIR